MHELSLCESLVHLIEKKAQEDHFQAVRTIRLEIGAYAGATEESLRFCFPIVAKGTVAQDAVLEFIPSSGTALRVKELDVV